MGQAAERQREDWRKRHPSLAAEERALRKGRAEAEKAHGHRRGGTVETLAHFAAAERRPGALARLHGAGAIDDVQLDSAVAIARVAERIGADVTVKTASLETRIDGGRRDGGFFEKLGAVQAEVAYGRWRAALGAGAAAVLDMVVGDPLPYPQAAARHRMSARRAKRLLIEALDLWPLYVREAVRAVDERALAAAHARLA